MPVKWGILSTAGINQQFLAGARASDQLRVVAVASRDAAKAERYARENKIERAHGSYEALLEDPEVEVVYISLPNALHVEWAVKALEAGKHVLCEKPLSRRVSEVERAFEAAGAAGRLLTEAFMFRHSPQTRKLVKLVADGAVGRAMMIRSSFSFVAGDPADVRLSPGLDGGGLMDVGCYCVSGSRLLAGEPERVSAEQVIGSAGVDVALTGTLRFSGDVLAHFDCGVALSSRDELEVVGDQGSLFLDDPWHCREPVIELRRSDGVERIECEAIDPYMLEAENMSAAIRGEQEPLLGRDDAIGQARAIAALYDAADSGRVVTL
jgi:D-xylose 1-dehydrogenase (NADP+, D-xylono-1,5-lactone-forming)